MAKFLVLAALLSASVAWSKELVELPWSLPKVEDTCWLGSWTSCKLEVVLSLDGSEVAAAKYQEMSESLKTPLERQIMAKVEYDIRIWWQSSPTHTKKGLLDTIAKSISVLPVTMKCQVKATMLMVRPLPNIDDATCTVQPSGCTILISSVQ